MQNDETTDVCILGAGPHGLAAAVHLRHAVPDIDITVLDRSPNWLHTWTEQFSRASIATLRSPMVHHPSPDPYALKQFVTDHELPRSGLPYDLPRTDVFMQFCRSLIERCKLDRPLARTPHTIRSTGKTITIEAAGPRVTASHLIIATNPHRRLIPDWVEPLLGRCPGLITHGADVDVRTLPDLSGQHVAIIGGGLSAAHLACGAAARGAQVHLISRRNLDISSFDTAPGWLGPKYLRLFDAETDPARRLAMALGARSGGSIPDWMHAQLVANDNITLDESTVVDHAQVAPTNRCTLQLSSGKRFEAQHVWLATGTRTDARALRCIRPLLQDVASVQGLPIVDDHLRLGPHRAFVMGRLATLQLGPATGNLWGAQRAAERITRAITGFDFTAEAAAPYAKHR